MKKHFSHEHPLILNEVYIAKSGDVCRGCNQEIVSCRSFVYTCSNNTSSSSTTTDSKSSSCAKFLLHKSCAELPPTIKHPHHHHVSLSIFSWKDYEFYSGPGKHIRKFCIICHDYYFRRGFIYDTTTFEVGPVCIRCGMESLDQDVLRSSSSSSSIYHPAHPQHPLEFVGHLSSFRCHACKVDDNIRDLSYRCTKCSHFWIHKSCADAPASFQFHFHHKHPLQLSFSLPQVYQKFYQYCRICIKGLRSRDWLYYCPKCRFFAHFHCARSNIDKIRLIEDEIIYDSEVVHLPAADESSADQLAEQFVMAMSTVITTNCFRHPAHEEHDLQLMSTINELNINQKHDEEALLLLCDGCVKPIRTDHDHQDNQFYGCVPCNFFMHKACAGFPREIDQHHLIHPAAAGTRLYADYSFCSSSRYFRCFGCGVLTNGIAFDDGNGNSRVHIGCLTLPKKIKHEAHTHQLNQVISTEEYCRACGGQYWNRYKYWCEKCGYYICAGCIMLPKTIKHPWDPHPLSLIYDPGMVSSDHEHEFECESCSQEIDCTNSWFYHCSECDLSFHLRSDNGEYCFEKSSYSRFSSIKYGATVIIDKLHHHSLTYVFNKKVRSCEKCFKNELLGLPVGECVSCKVIFCERCVRKHMGS